MNEMLGDEGETTPTLDELMPAEEAPKRSLHEASSRNEASTLSLVGPAESVSESYQVMMEEARTGVRYTADQARAAITRANGTTDFGTLIQMLGDQKLDMQTKKNLVEAYDGNAFLSDPRVKLATDGLTKASEGEDSQGHTARLYVADSMREILEGREKEQALINQLAAKGSLNVGSNLADLGAMALIPFATNAIVGAVGGEMEGKAGFVGDSKAGLLPGETINNMRKKLSTLPSTERLEYIQKLITVLDSKAGVIFPGSNDVAKLEILRAVTEPGRYDNFDRFLDDATTVLDMIGLGGAFRALRKLPEAVKGVDKGVGAVKGFDPGLPPSVPFVKPSAGIEQGDLAKLTIRHNKKLSPIAEALIEQRVMDRVVANAHIPTISPVSPLSIISNTNPGDARNLIKAIEAGDDEVSLALSGVKRDDALASAVLPQVLVTGDKVITKVSDPFKLLEVDNELIKASRNLGASYFTAAERLRAKGTITRGFTEAVGLTLRDGMGGFKIAEDGRHFKVSAVYGNGQNPFSDPEQAMEQAKVALRGQGVRDDEITLMKLDGDGYSPTTLKEVGGKEGNYLVKIDSLQDFDFNTVRASEKGSKLEGLTVKKNWLDKVPVLSKWNASRYALDPASMLDPVLTNAMSAGTDRSAYIDKIFLELTSKFSDKLKKMPADRAKAVEQHLKEANEHGIAFDRGSLLTKFSPAEVDAIHDWKKVWDNHYYFENDDLVKTLNAEGYMYFRNNNVDLFAKPVDQNAPTDKVAIGLNQTVSRVYNPVTNAHEFISKAELDMLYKAGGTLAKLRRPVDLAGERATYIISRNDSSGYLRKFRDTDAVLNYRPMHYTRSYKAAKFVDEITPDGFRRAIAVGPDTPSANAFRHGKELANPQNRYVVRDDERGIVRGNDDWFDTESASGRLAQRHRGQILGNTQGTSLLGEGSFIVDPATSAINAAKSLSGRITMRPVIEASKQRIMDQYGHLFKTDDFGNPKYPSILDDIGSKGNHTSKEVADARTSVAYLQSIENGLGDSIDDMYKQALNSIANSVGELGFGGIERGIRLAAEQNVANRVKGLVFYSYIVMSNFLRQWMIQSHGAVRTLAINPVHVATGGMARDMADAAMYATTGKANTEFTKFLDESGFLAGLDKNNLVRGSLSNMAAHRNDTVAGIRKVTVEWPRKIGFDLGEGTHMVAWAASVFDKAKQAGRNVNDKTVRDELIGEIRGLTGEMNQVGDMPYNSGAMSVLTQFLQVPHKSFLLYANRKIDNNTKARLLLADTMLFGTAGGIITQTFFGDTLPEDPEMRYLITEGVEASIFNKIFKEAFDQDQDLDLSAFNPYGLDGFVKLYLAAFGDGDMSMVAPAYHLMNPETGRIPLAMKELFRFFSGSIETDLPPATLVSVADKVAKISSGYSSGAAAYAALEMGKWKSAAGDELPGEVTFPLAVMKSLGFDRLSTREMYKLSQERFADQKALKEDILKDLKATQRILSDAMNGTKSDVDLARRASNIMLSRYADNDFAMQIITQQLKKDLTGKESMLMMQMMKHSGIKDAGATRDQILRSGLDDEMKEILIDRYENDVLKD